jgi:hypothetical protein
VPHPSGDDDKLFSIFEEHTELLIRAKAGKDVEEEKIPTVAIAKKGNRTAEETSREHEGLPADEGVEVVEVVAAMAGASAGRGADGAEDLDDLLGLVGLQLSPELLDETFAVERLDPVGQRLGWVGEGVPIQEELEDLDHLGVP